MALTRREALPLLAAPALPGNRPRVAMTLDDAAWRMIPTAYAKRAREGMLQALGRRQAALFVAGVNVDNPGGRAILGEWDGAGHLLGNHTYSHTPVFRTTPEAFAADVARNEGVLKPWRRFVRRFRFPMLKEGATREVRDAVRAMLRQMGYASGAVTIDTSDWYYDARLRERLKREPDFDVTRYREPYLAHLWRSVEYYDGLARDVLGTSPAHTMLLHYNLINGLFLRDILAMFEKRGWEVVDAEAAFADPVFARQPDTAPAGESLVWALAKETGRFEKRLRYPGEDSAYEKSILDKLDL